MMLADFSLGTGEIGLTLSGLLTISYVLGGMFFKEKIKAIETQGERITLLEKQAAVSEAAKVADRVTKLEEDMHELRAEVKTITTKLDIILEWIQGQNNRPNHGHGIMRRDSE